jgi:serine/threonine protein kinase
MPFDPWSPGRLLLDEFEIERKLGEGGMGAVFLVRSRRTREAFAVKKAKITDRGRERAFLTELQHWIDLPEHPHLTECRFFRTVQDEIAIFAEYVAGGSLGSWIREGKRRSLDDIIDMAIQFAWGLHAAHECGLVHQDVKPDNALLTADGTLKVTDFGLARARAAVSSSSPARSDIHLPLLEAPPLAGPTVPPTLLVSVGGMTPAYRSPEQAALRPVSRKTDIWSWGLSVFEMFTAGVRWSDGQTAERLLELYLHDRSDWLPRMPYDVADVLRRCFHKPPQDRWVSLAEAANALKEAYRHAVGREYPRPQPATIVDRPKLPKRRGTGEQDADTWSPRRWLQRAIQAGGGDPTAVAGREDEGLATPRARMITDIADLQEARRIYERLIVGGRHDLLSELAAMMAQKCALHFRSGDLPGAIKINEEILQVVEQLLRDDRETWFSHLIDTYINHGYYRGANEDHRGAIEAYDRALSLCRMRIGEATTGAEAERFGRELAGQLALLYKNKAAACSSLNDRSQSLALYDKARQVLLKLIKEDRTPQLIDDLASCYMGEATDLEILGREWNAARSYDEAITLRERLINEEGQLKFSESLSRAYINKSSLLHKQGEPKEAAVLLEKAQVIRERLVNEEGRHDLLPGLARLYAIRARNLGDLRDTAGARNMLDRAIRLWERVVIREGNREHANELAMSYMNCGLSYADEKQYEEAIRWYDRALELLERLVNEEGHVEHSPDLAGTYMNKSNALRKLGQKREGLELFDRLIPIWERLAAEGKRHLVPELAKAYGNQVDAAREVGEYATALKLADRCIDLYLELIAKWGRGDLLWALERLLLRRTTIRQKLCDRTQAFAELRETVQRIQDRLEEAHPHRDDEPPLRDLLEYAASGGTSRYWRAELENESETGADEP